MITQSLLASVVSIARDAGAAIMRIYEREIDVSYKDDHSPLTEADLAAHHIIADYLQVLSPNIPILSEEDVQTFNGANEAGYYWLVDPLDGTKEFIKRNGEFTVNIALIHLGQPVLGVVYAPAMGTLYSAARGLGAFKTLGPKEHRIHAEPHQPGRPWRVVGSRSHGGDELNAWLQGLGDHELIPMGSSLKLCLVAEGRADIYPRLGPTSLWDTAAAQCVAEEAGARVTDLEGQSLSYQSPSQILNPYFVVTVGNFSSFKR
jgi:3'(2'), 5'-bisphosphate nucleotidase